MIDGVFIFQRPFQHGVLYASLTIDSIRQKTQAYT